MNPKDACSPFIRSGWRPAHTLVRRAARASAAVAIVAAMLLPAHAAVQTSIWQNPIGGSWDNPALWSTNPNFPNNGGGGIATYDAVIDKLGSPYTISLGVNITLETLTLNSANATIDQTAGTFTATDAINLLAGTYELDGGTISNTTINVAGGMMIFSSLNGNILSNNTTLQGDLNLSSIPNARVRLQSGATFTGDATLGADNSILAIEDTRSLTGKTINLDGNNAFLTIDGGNTLTLAASTLVRGRGNITSGFFVNAVGTVVNQGTIRADLNGQTLTVSPVSFSNAGTTEAINGSTLNIAATTWSNTGNINASGGSTVNFQGTWDNTGGTAAVSATSSLNLGGSFTTAHLGTIDNSAGGAVSVTGLWDNTGGNFTFNATTGSWRLADGEVRGGQITPGAGGQTLLFGNNNSSRLTNGLILNGDLSLSAFPGARVRLQSGATFTGNASLGADSSILAFEDTRILTGKTINLDGNNDYLTIDGSNTLTLGASTLVRGRGTITVGFFINDVGSVVNQGTIRADLAGQVLTVSPTSFSNAGLAEAVNGSTLNIAANNWSNTGNINASGGSTVNFQGTWDNTGGMATVSATSSLNLGGTFTTAHLGTIDNSAGGAVTVMGLWDNTGGNFTFNATTGSWRLADGEVRGGQITPGAGGQTLLFGNNNSNRLTNGLILNGDLSLSAFPGARVRLQSGATFTGNASLGADNSVLGIEDTRALTGKTINLDGNNAFLTIDGSNTLTLGASTLVRGHGTITNGFFVNAIGTVVNQGTIRADLNGQVLTVSPTSFSNAGTTEAINGSTLNIAATNWSNTGNINGSGGSTVNFQSAWDNTGGTATVSATSSLNLGGSFTTAHLGTIDNNAGGAVTVTGLWDNTGGNFNFSASTGSWRLADGEVRGGQITPGAGGQTLLFGNNNSSRLTNGLILNGDLNLSAFSGARVRLQSGATFTGDANLGADNSVLGIEDTRALTGKTINLDGNNAFLTIDGGNTLTLGASTLVRGRGSITNGFFVNAVGTIVNQGTIRADLSGQTLTVNPTSFSTSGTMEAVNGGTLNVPSGYTQTGGMTRVNGGTINSNAPILLNGGALQGNGTIGANLFAGGVIDPTSGAPTGLKITGDLSLSANSEFRFEIGGTVQGTNYDLLTEGGSVALSLNGQLVLRFANGFQNSVAIGDTFSILMSNQALSGAFSNIASGSRLRTADGLGSFIVNYGAGSPFGADKVVLSNSQLVPPPDVTTGVATKIGIASAQLNGTIDPNTAVTDYFFEYGTDIHYGSFTATVSAGGGDDPTPVSAVITGLSASTTYHFRLVGSTPAGDFHGDDATFTTLTPGIVAVLEKNAPAPDVPGATFLRFSQPAINDPAHIAVLASLTLKTGTPVKVTAANDTGIWANAGTDVFKLIAREGDPAPDKVGAVASTSPIFAKLSDPVFASGDHLAFSARLKPGTNGVTGQNAAGLWSNVGGTLALIARQGDVAAGAGTATFASFVSFALPDSGGVIFIAKLKGAPPAKDMGIWVADEAGTLSLVAREGDQLQIDGSLKTIKTLQFLPPVPVVGGQSRGFNDAGALAFRAAFTDKTQAIIVRDSGGLTAVASTGPASPDAPGAPANAKFLALGPPAINGAGHVSFFSTLAHGGLVTAATDGGIWRENSASGLEAVALKGGDAPTTHGKFAGLSNPVSRSDDAVAFTATLKADPKNGITAANLSGIWSTIGGTLAPVIRQGASAAGTSDVFGSFTAVGLPDIGGPVFLARLKHSKTANGTNDQGIWVADEAGGISLLARTGFPLFAGEQRTIRLLQFLPAVLAAPGQTRSFNRTGIVAFHASFSDRSEGIYKVIR